MKKIKLMLALAIFFVSCGPSYKLIGEINMISTRNISFKENYAVIQSYAGSGKKNVNKNKSYTVQGAVDNLVKSVPGGEFVMNAKIWFVDGIYYAVVGDVYGFSGEKNYMGFKKGQKVQWKVMGLKFQGTVVNLKSDKEITVETETGVFKNFNPDELTILE